MRDARGDYGCVDSLGAVLGFERLESEVRWEAGEVGYDDY